MGDFRFYEHRGGAAPTVQDILESTRVPAVSPTSAAPAAATPEATDSGLYALYQQPNRAQSRAEMMRSVAFRPQSAGTRDFAAPIMAFMAGKEMRKAREFDDAQQAEIKEFKERKKNWEQVRANQQALQAERQKFQEFLPSFQQDYAQRYRQLVASKAENPQAEMSKYAADRMNQWAKDNQITNLPYFKSMNLWQGGQATFLASKDGKNFKQGKIINGNVMIDKDGVMVPAGDDWVDRGMMGAQTAQQRAEGAGLRGKEHRYLTPKGELITATSPEAAIKAGANRVMMDVYEPDEFGESIKKTQIYSLPGMAPDEQPPAEEPPAPAPAPKQPSAFGQAMRAVAGSIMPMGSQVADVAARAAGAPRRQQVPQQRIPAAGGAQQPTTDKAGRPIYQGPDGNWYYQQ